MKFNDIVSHNLKEFINSSEFSSVNHLRISKANSLEHEIKKAEIFTKLVHSGHFVLTEAKCLESQCRPDILVLDVLPMIAYEIVKSESELSIYNKNIKYPFIVKEVEVKNEI